MCEKTLTLQVPPALQERLEALAGRLDQDIDSVLLQALEEYAERWEDHLRDLDAIDSGTDERVMLQVVNE